MPAYWLTFKPRSATTPRGWPIEDLRALVRRFEDNPVTTSEWWRIASSKSARVGDRVYAFKQGNDPRGIFAVGTIIKGPVLISADLDPTPRYRALIQFEALVDPTESFLPSLAQISDIAPSTLIDAQASGTSVPPGIISELERRLAPFANFANPSPRRPPSR